MEAEIALDVSGLGIIFYSPSHAKHIAAGSDYLEANYTTGAQVQRHIQQGTIVGFGTGSSGTFLLRIGSGYPDEERIDSSDFKLRLGVNVVDELLCFRDLYDLLDWDPTCPTGQGYKLANGYYHVTLCSNLPPSGRLGDDQVIEVYLQPLTAMPKLSASGVPTLCR